MSLLQVTGTGKRVADTFTLQPVYFSQEPGQKLAIAGATGSGKSTLLKIIAGLEEAGTGTILFEDTKVKGPDYRLIPGQPGIAYLSQHYELRNHYRMEELLGYADMLPEGEAAALFALCRIDHLLQRKTDQLSGGEQQRIALARLLLTAPRLLILDEPFSNLDLIHKNILKNVLGDVAAKTGLSYILASHDPADLLPWADELLILKDGVLIQKGSPETVYRFPEEAYTAALLGTYNLLSAAQAKALALPPAPEGKRIFCRPEQCSVYGQPGNNRPEAIVQKILFRGSYYEAEVLLEGQLLKAVVHHKIPEGTKVYLSLQQDNVWYL